MLKSPFLPDNVAVCFIGDEGLGVLIAQSLLSYGMKVFIASNDERLLENIASLDQAFSLHRVSQIDFMSISRLRQDVLAQEGKVDLLLNLGGFNNSLETEPLPETWQQFVDLDLLCVVNSTNAFFDVMASSDRRTVIVNMEQALLSDELDVDDFRKQLSNGVEYATDAIKHRLSGEKYSNTTVHILKHTPVPLDLSAEITGKKNLKTSYLDKLFEDISRGAYKIYNPLLNKYLVSHLV